MTWVLQVKLGLRPGQHRAESIQGLPGHLVPSFDCRATHFHVIHAHAGGAGCAAVESRIIEDLEIAVGKAAASPAEAKDGRDLRIGAHGQQRAATRDIVGQHASLRATE